MNDIVHSPIGATALFGLGLSVKEWEHNAYANLALERHCHIGLVSLKTMLYRYQTSLLMQTLRRLRSMSLFAVSRLMSLHSCKLHQVLRWKNTQLLRRARLISKQHLFLSSKSVLAIQDDSFVINTLTLCFKIRMSCSI